MKKDGNRSDVGGGGVLLTRVQKENLSSFFNLPTKNVLLRFIYVLTLKSSVITILDARV
jgi:hypothetical protein